MKNSKCHRVALVYGFWAQNIGNAFFNIGGRWLLEQVFGPANVSVVRDQPGYRTFHEQHKGNPTNDVLLLNHLDVDFVVLQGPVMTTSFRALWEPTFRIFRDRGIKTVLLGAAFFRYTKEEIDSVRQFLTEYPPAIISTRDHITFEFVKNWVKWTHNGIDSGFFVSDAYKPASLVGGPFLAMNFDRYPEPRITIEKGIPTDDSSSMQAFVWQQDKWHLRIPKIQKYFSNMGKATAYFGHLIDFRRLPKSLGGYLVVRPEHRYAPHMTWKIYKQPNAMTSDEPYTFLTVYSASELTLSDRVHACVATLAYGNPAMLFSPTPRQALFGRLGLNNIREKPVYVDQQYLAVQKQEQLQFLRDALDDLGG